MPPSSREWIAFRPGVVASDQAKGRAILSSSAARSLHTASNAGSLKQASGGLAAAAEESSAQAASVSTAAQQASASVASVAAYVPGGVVLGMLEDGIGYIQLTQFGDRTGADFKQALKQLQQQGVRALILDLRNNPGGFLDAAVEVAEPFFKPGELIVYTRGRTAESRQEGRAGRTAGGLILPGRFDFYCEPIKIRDARLVPFIWELNVHGYNYACLERRAR